MAARDVKSEAREILAVCSLIESSGPVPGRAWSMWKNKRYRAIWTMLAAGVSVKEVARATAMSRQGIYNTLEFGADLARCWKDRRAVGRYGRTITGEKVA